MLHLEGFVGSTKTAILSKQSGGKKQTRFSHTFLAETITYIQLVLFIILAVYERARNSKQNCALLTPSLFLIQFTSILPKLTPSQLQLV